MGSASRPLQFQHRTNSFFRLLPPIEFAHADISSDDYYQKWSKGRHKKPTHIFGGQIVPVINKLLAATLPRLDDPDMLSPNEITIPKIVRVEIDTADKETEGVDASNPVILSSNVSNAAGNVDVPNESPAVGQKVARKILGGTIFRGEVVEVSLSQHFQLCH